MAHLCSKSIKESMLPDPRWISSRRGQERCFTRNGECQTGSTRAVPLKACFRSKVHCLPLHTFLFAFTHASQPNGARCYVSCVLKYKFEMKFRICVVFGYPFGWLHLMLCHNVHLAQSTFAPFLGAVLYVGGYVGNFGGMLSPIHRYIHMVSLALLSCERVVYRVSSVF